MKQTIFIAYNTDSIVDDNTIVKEPCCKCEEQRRSIFQTLYDKYKSDGKYELYFDILHDEYGKKDLYYHIDKNESIISMDNTRAIIFVISTAEVSFWQLLEAFFASYHNKKILYISVKKFIKLINGHKLDRFIDYHLRRK